MMTQKRRYVDTGRRLQALRKNTLKVSAQDFADSLGISLSLLRQMEVGDKNVSNETLKKIHAVYNVPADTVLSGRTYLDGTKPKPSDPLSLEIKIARLEARVEQLERMLVEVLQSKNLTADQV